MSQAPQSYANHVRLVPLYHFVLGGLLGVLFVRAVIVLWRHPGAEAVYQLVPAVALLLMGFYLRNFPVVVQDRVIRLEMRLRLAELAPDVMSRFSRLTPAQLAALRFAGDGELPALARQVLDGKLVAPDDIKKSVKDWQADHLRA